MIRPYPERNEAVVSAEYYPSGALRSLMLSKEILIDTPLGPLVPNYVYDDARKKYAPGVVFYESGALKSLRLLNVTEVPTPLGKKLPAEKLSFYENGALKRLFPLDGRLSGFWSEKDERKLLSPIPLKFSFGAFNILASGIAFYPEGSIRSVTLWPGENLSLPLSSGMVKVGAGFSLYPEGMLQSVEPKVPVKVETPLGPMEAFDPEALGVCADSNSLGFSPEGKVVKLKALVILEYLKGGGQLVIKPFSKPHPLDDARVLHRPLSFVFSPTKVTVSRDLLGEGPYCLELCSKLTLRPYIAHRLARITIK